MKRVDPAVQQAIAWQLELEARQQAAHEHAPLQAWLARDPRHRQVWQRLQAVDQRFHSLPTAAGRALQRPGKRAGKPLLLALALGLAVLLGQHIYDPFAPPKQRASYQLASAEQRTLHLADQTQLQLDAQTRLDLHYSARQRQLRLHSGQIAITTGHDSTRPFLVETPNARLRALGTRFTVSHLDGVTVLAVQQSAVAVSQGEDGAETIVPAGQQLRIAAQIGQPQPAAVGADAWTRGMTVAEQRPLGSLVAELARHYRGQLSLDPRVAELKVNGSFSLRNPQQTLLALQAVLPIRVEAPQAGHLQILPAQP